jgi:hypothetical protein
MSGRETHQMAGQTSGGSVVPSGKRQQKHPKCSDHPRCFDIFITCTVALSAEIVVLQDPSTGCIAEGTGPSVIGLKHLKH